MAAVGMGSAEAALLDQSLSNQLNVSRAVEKCVTVAVPTATVTVNARLMVSAAGVENTTQSSTTVSTGILGQVRVCVAADADAQLVLNAHANARLNGTTLHVDAQATAQAAANVKVTANGAQVL